ncbi:hypothetical protein A9264_04245 [Vibrio sp. UCD-FRSSP16_10]|uniref:hypothetical protein n=1 Tax=unclassified Vibrio TaxID=2614977 RepID=UPI0007FEE589|nr:MULTISPECIES: hypothetical protein [unclassified Vibrio]OBT10177.1 hypothetical protein A9260_05695 [Vibrio sp. UCD-FRSSP16_30]OBT18967.1 hypothetical protein A9264_04245 [Vibrio sp. UCD-FRSSP16_10]
MLFMYSLVALSGVSLAVGIVRKKRPNVADETNEEISQYLKETGYWADEYRKAQSSYQRLQIELSHSIANFHRLSPAQQQAHSAALNELTAHVEQRKQRMQRAQQRYQELAY